MQILSSSPTKSRYPSNTKASPSRLVSPAPPSISGNRFPIEQPEILNQSVSSNKKLISELPLEACSKAKEAGKLPSYTTSLVLNLVHHYNLDVNLPVLSNSFSIFHCSCLSGSLELVSSLSPLADINSLTDHGDSPLYLAVYAAAHKARRGTNNGQAGVEVVRHLLKAGSAVNQSNLAGFTALHQASRLSSPHMVRLLLDWGADPQVESVERSVESTRSNSVMSRISSVVTRSKINKVWRKGLNQSVMSGEKRQKM